MKSALEALLSVGTVSVNRSTAIDDVGFEYTVNKPR
jgi:hypothetical protein